MGHTSYRNLCSRIFAEKVESDGNRREVTSLDVPWRSDKTERAGRDCKEDYYKMTQDGSEASTRKVFEEDRVTVKKTKASKNNDSRYSEYQTGGRCRFGVWRRSHRHDELAADRRTGGRSSLEPTTPIATSSVLRS